METTRRVIGAAIEVHRCLGPGLLEKVYESALCYEFDLHAIKYARQVSLPAHYKGVVLDGQLRIDLLVDEEVVVELKCVDQLAPVHGAQMLTYLRLGGFPTGLLLNFNTVVLRHGIRRFSL